MNNMKELKKIGVDKFDHIALDAKEHPSTSDYKIIYARLPETLEEYVRGNGKQKLIIINKKSIEKTLRNKKRTFRAYIYYPFNDSSILCKYVFDKRTQTIKPLDFEFLDNCIPTISKTCLERILNQNKS